MRKNGANQTQTYIFTKYSTPLPVLFYFCEIFRKNILKNTCELLLLLTAQKTWKISSNTSLNKTYISFSRFLLTDVYACVYLNCRSKFVICNVAVYIALVIRLLKCSYLFPNCVYTAQSVAHSSSRSYTRLPQLSVKVAKLG